MRYKVVNIFDNPAPGAYVTDSSFTLPFLLGPVFFWTALLCSGGYHLERGGMSLHDAFGVNCKIGATSENEGACVKYICVYVG